MVNLLYCELLKLKRSKMLLISFLGALVAPILMFVQGIRSHYSSDKIVSMTNFFESNNTYSMLMFGLIVYVVITAFLFSREYSENTLKTIITIPVQRLKFIICKFIMLFIWIVLLTLISWASICIFSIIFNAIFGLSDFSFLVAFIYLGKMLLGGLLIFLTLSPFAFLSMRSKGVVIPVIVGAAVAMVNVLLSSETLGAVFPWSASYFLISGKITASFFYPLSICLIAATFMFGFLMCAVSFKRKDIK